ncbi:hypothetical protein Kpol_348p13 [Vanderwaltozyma polyspora DSM 70294]|uniref:Formate/nitrite transporter n=1 Tax=Vanderwaltozyma polyspora (strain ATCC 22028 / DSM 70294 / BCRC 21397 / CBS 2163 / NBRC 10782 / NRRL Y-8283 / UCD 57-17) TaxID=436907 RepID=A7TS59_VANPO|nr:uncharacterized protein Kpol_348p13 [Vanderwaltozyma polyspora DSM 70294]EDO14909.1 hypothetical protein Kpol_348p13 [Vanderwaltozyma polyspora DSM 70294]
MVGVNDYISPHDAALAVVATAMKKSRLHIDTLIINSFLGGTFFTCGGLLNLAVHSDNPNLFSNNPGILNAISGVTYGIALYFVVITGADLFNSNILFFSVALCRRAVTIFDLLISWFVSWIGNIASSLLISYLFGYLSGIGKTKLWKETSKTLIEEKASFSFIETFLKGIGGNFLVSLGIYLQLMARPIHVRLIVLILPIFTFTTIGFTHVIGDMAIAYIGMFNGGNVSVGEYIWKLLIPASVGNIIGGSVFGIVVPFYLHLIVVERDVKELDLPNYDTRDVQPELNTDSRIVRVPNKVPNKVHPDISGSLNIKSYQNDSNNNGDEVTHISTSSFSDSISRTTTDDVSLINSVQAYTTGVANSITNDDTNELRQTRTQMTQNSSRAGANYSSTLSRSPPGVFPVFGMGEPLTREKTIQNSTYRPAPQPNTLIASSSTTSSANILNKHVSNNRINSLLPSNTWSNDKEQEKEQVQQQQQYQEYYNNSNNSINQYDVLNKRPGARLKRALSIISAATTSSNTNSNHDRETSNSRLPTTNQDLPYLKEANIKSIRKPKASKQKMNPMNTISRQFSKANH